MKPFYFTSFGTKWFQIALEADRETVPNGALILCFIMGTYMVYLVI